MVKEKTIRSVGELLEFLKDNIGNNELFFRGEAKDYEFNKLTPTLYRKSIARKGYEVGYDNSSLIREYKMASRELYEHIENISQRNLDNFMAFCQHHSLPTPLLDVSESPLVGLFFAAIDHKENDGKLYIFNRKYSIRMSSSILNYNSNLDIIDIYFNDYYKKYIEYFKNYCEESLDQKIYFEKELFPKLLSGLKKYVKNRGILDENPEDFEEFMDAENLDDLKDIIFNKELKNNDVRDKFLTFTSNLDIRTYLTHERCIGREFIDEKRYLEPLSTSYYIYGFIMWLSSVDSLEMSHDLNSQNLSFYVKPTFVHERIKSQMGVFLLSLPYVDRDVDGDLKNDIAHPKPVYSITIPSTYKDKIIKELDLLGINAGNLYLDIDHVAEYISKIHFKN